MDEMMKTLKPIARLDVSIFKPITLKKIRDDWKTGGCNKLPIYETDDGFLFVRENGMNIEFYHYRSTNLKTVIEMISRNIMSAEKLKRSQIETIGVNELFVK